MFAEHYKTRWRTYQQVIAFLPRMIKFVPMKKLIAGNWKMNGSKASACELIDNIGAGLAENEALLEKCELLVCPSFVHICAVKRKVDKGFMAVHVGGQDCAATENGAYTGDISATMLNDMGASYVIVGHSERRACHKESSAYINEKAARAHMHGLISIICVGESFDNREAGEEFEIVGKQLHESLPDGATAKNTVIAYEPVWAIGTGASASVDDVRAMHGFIREQLQEKLADSANMRILYGGSVKPENASALFEVDNVDGALIGGASLTAEQFLEIAKAA